MESKALSDGISHSILQGDREGAWWHMSDLVKSKINIFYNSNEDEHLDEFIHASKKYIELSMELGHEVSAAYTGIATGTHLEKLDHPSTADFFAEAAKNHMEIKYSRRPWPEELTERGFSGEGWNPIGL